MGIVTFVFFIIGVILGFILSLVIMKPLRAYNEGFDAAKNIYSDWSQGFDDGYDAAKKVHSDWSLGFDDGYKAGIKRGKEEHSDECDERGN